MNRGSCSGDQSLWGGLESLPLQKYGRARSVSLENPSGAKGKAGMAKSSLGPSRKGAPFLVKMAAESIVTLAEIDGPGVIGHILLTVTEFTETKQRAMSDLVLRIYWDEEAVPSVEAPLGDFFCCGFGRERRVNSMPIVVNPAHSMHCYFPMPFQKKAKVTLENRHAEEIPVVAYQIDYVLTDELPMDIRYFHAQWRGEQITQQQKEYTLLDQVKGSGHYVGAYLTWMRSPQNGFYRWRIMDPVIFEEDFKVTIRRTEIFGEKDTACPEEVASVAYWYQSEPHNPFDIWMKKEDRRP